MSEREIETIDPEIEPEYVGAHSALSSSLCQNWMGDTPSEMEQCEVPATHTVVMFDGKGLCEIAMCDECGEPQDVDFHEREWSGEVHE